MTEGFDGDQHRRGHSELMIWFGHYIKSTNDAEKQIDNLIDDRSKGEHNATEDMIVDVAEEVSNKDETIVKLGTKSTTLEKENKVLKEQLEQMKRVVLNMDKALKAKQG